MAFERFGKDGPLTVKFLSLLVTHFNKVSRDAREGVWLFQCLSYAIAHGKAANVLAYSVCFVETCDVGLIDALGVALMCFSHYFFIVFIFLFFFSLPDLNWYL